MLMLKSRYQDHFSASTTGYQVGKDKACFYVPQSMEGASMGKLENYVTHVCNKKRKID